MRNTLYQSVASPRSAAYCNEAGLDRPWVKPAGGTCNLTPLRGCECGVPTGGGVSRLPNAHSYNTAWLSASSAVQYAVSLLDIVSAGSTCNVRTDLNRKFCTFRRRSRPQKVDNPIRTLQPVRLTSFRSVSTAAWAVVRRTGEFIHKMDAAAGRMYGCH